MALHGSLHFREGVSKVGIVTERDKDEMFDAGGFRCVDEADLAIQVNALDGIPLLTREGRRCRRDDGLYAPAGALDG